MLLNYSYTCSPIWWLYADCVFQVIFLTTMATNYSRITITKEITEYKQAIALETDTNDTHMLEDY